MVVGWLMVGAEMVLGVEGWYCICRQMANSLEGA